MSEDTWTFKYEPGVRWYWRVIVNLLRFKSDFVVEEATEAACGQTFTSSVWSRVLACAPLCVCVLCPEGMLKCTVLLGPTLALLMPSESPASRDSRSALL